MDKDLQAHNWSNYWQGRAAGQTGAALVGVGVENDADIAGFWDEELRGLGPDLSLLDLACGAGSVIRRAAGLGFGNLTGADISPGAIASLTQAFPSATGIIAPADDTGLPAGSFDLVVSQFGFEYAGVQSTAPEIVRLLAPGGTFLALTHLDGSVIEQEVEGKLGQAKAIEETGFIAAAKQMFDAAKSEKGEDAFQAAVENFRKPQDALLALAKTHGELAGHLYSGTQTLYERRQAYDLADIFGWLDGMAGEISAYRGRMQSMKDAALSEKDIMALLAQFKTLGLDCEPQEILKVGFHEDHLGWILRAQKPN
jgi:SAM-dependent methyltransferase